jgi:hypothetical protein
MEGPIYLVSWVGAVCAAWFLWEFGIKVLMLDVMRERLFEIRFQLFRLGMSGEISYDNEAYRAVETLMSGLIRFGHRITFLTWLFSTFEVERAKKEKDYVDVSAQITLKISRLEPETQAKLIALLKDVQSAVIVYTAFSSLLFLSIYLTFKLCQLLGIWHPDGKESLSKVIEREAYLAEMRRGLRLAAA